MAYSGHWDTLLKVGDVCLHREFAERAFQAAKKEAAALDAGGWNVGSVITDKKDR